MGSIIKATVQWYQKVKEVMINSQYPQVWAFVRRNELGLIKVKPYVLQQWIYNIKEMKKKADKIPKNDIRKYCECWE